jgi:hypothetical protein
MNMKNMAKLAMIGTLMAAGISNLHAQTTIVRNVNIQLTANVQTSENNLTVEKGGNKEVIAAISADMEGVPPKSKLLVTTPIEGEGTTYILRASGSPDVDVSSFFDQHQIGDAVTKTAGSSTTIISIQSFSFHSSTLSFEVSGHTSSKLVNVKNGGVSSTDNATVAGSGDVNGDLAIYKGTVSFTSPKAE